MMWNEGQFSERLKVHLREGCAIAYIERDGDVGAAAGYHIDASGPHECSSPLTGGERRAGGPSRPRKDLPVCPNDIA
jgi:hypothetical protein